MSDEEDDLEIIEEPQNSDGEDASNREEANEGGESAQAGETGEGDSQAATKKEPKVKRVRNPQPKLNVERLKGPRGLMALGPMFEQVRFKGRHHEEEDLALLMKKYEYWCHRLFPKFSFDDCIERIERLGHKKPMQAYIKRIRLDMVLDEPPSEQEVQPEIDDEEPHSSNLSMEKESSSDQAFDNLRENVHLPQSETELTDEQLERIKINQERAKRLQRQRLLMQKKKLEAANEKGPGGTNVGYDDSIMSQKVDAAEQMSVDLSQTFESQELNESVELMSGSPQTSDAQKFPESMAVNTLTFDPAEPQPCCSKSNDNFNANTSQKLSPFNKGITESMFANTNRKKT